MDDVVRETEETIIVEVVYKKEEAPSLEPSISEWSSLDSEQRNLLLGIKSAGGSKDFESSVCSGNICPKYIALSDSDVYRHQFYKYPAVTDPAVLSALLEPFDTPSYSSDGQELYLKICEEMGQCPVRMFYRGLITPEIDLRFYGVNPAGVRAMALAMTKNTNVKRLSFYDNFLTLDATYHLAEMLQQNNYLRELDLSGCRIGVNGMRNICAGLTVNRTLRKLNLDRNQLSDEGGEVICNAVWEGIDVSEIVLSNNDLGVDFAVSFAKAAEYYFALTKLDLSANQINLPGQAGFLLTKVAVCDNLRELNLARNALSGMKVGKGIQTLLQSAANLEHLNLASNKLKGDAVTPWIDDLRRSNLIILNLSDNPLSVSDAMQLMIKMRLKSVKLKSLLMDNVSVNGKFIELYEAVRETKPNFSSSFGHVNLDAPTVGKDLKSIVLDRADFLKTSKKGKMHIATIAQKLLKEKSDIITAQEFAQYCTQVGAKLDNGLMDEICNAFRGPVKGKAKGVPLNVRALTEFVLRKWPEKKLPPTPPPEPEVHEEYVSHKVREKKGKKGKEKK